MPMKSHLSQSQSRLSEEEREQLKLAVLEMKARGLVVPNTDIIRGKINWPVDQNGYFVREDGMPFKTDNPEQLLFLATRARFSAFFGSRGSGKTASGAQKALRKIKDGWSGSVINPDFENFKYSTWTEFRQWIPWHEVIPSQQYRQNPGWEASKPFTIVFKNGARAYCKGLKDPDSARGPNINWLWYDEGRRDKTGLAWKIAIASVRVGDNPQAWTTTTPAIFDSWLYRFFVKKEIPEEALKLFKELLGEDTPLVFTTFAKLDNNKSNLDPGFYASLLATYTTGWLKKQELDGEFADEGGALGNRDWFNGRAIYEIPSTATRLIRYWDLAASEKKISKRKSDDPDSTIGTLLAYDKGTFIIADQVGGQLQWGDIKKLIINTSARDDAKVEYYIEQEPASGGINQVKQIASEPELANRKVLPHNPRDFGDKIMRALPWFSKAQLGLISYIPGTWNEPLFDQVTNFPLGMHDDRVDSVSGAFAVMSGKKKWNDIPFTKV